MRKFGVFGKVYARDDVKDRKYYNEASLLGAWAVKGAEQPDPQALATLSERGDRHFAVTAAAAGVNRSRRLRQSLWSPTS